MDIWMCPRFFGFGPLVAKNSVFWWKNGVWGGGVKNVKNQFFFLVHLFIFKNFSVYSKKREMTLLQLFENFWSAVEMGGSLDKFDRINFSKLKM